MHLIAVIMGSPTRDERNALAAKMLDWGFANYAMFSDTDGTMDDISVTGGVKNTLSVKHEAFETVVEKGAVSKIETVYDVPETIAAPVKAGEKVGTVIFKSGDTVLGTADIVAAESVEKIGFLTLLPRILRWMLCSPEI